MTIISDISYAIENMGNESLYPMMEFMKELNWDAIDDDMQIKLLVNLESVFKYLYNNANNKGPNQNVQNPHSEIHNKIFEAINFSLNNPSGVDFYDGFMLRTDDKSELIGFNDRFKSILSQHPEGLKKY